MENSDEINLSIADIAMLKQIVEVASQRGAFKAEEMSSVGTVYDKVTAWLEQVVPNEEKSDQGETDD